MFRDLLQIRQKITLALFFIFAAKLVVAQANKPDTSIIFCGIIAHSDSSQNITFRFYKDFLTLEEINYTSPIINDSFYIKIPYRENTPGFITFDRINVPVFVEKGDSLFVESSAKSFAQSLKYRGKGALANNYLRATFLRFDAKNVRRVEEEIAKNTAGKYQQLLTVCKTEKLNFLENFLSERDTQFTKTFREYVKADINYWWGQNLMRYREDHPASDVLPVSLNLSNEYFKFMETLDLNKETVLNNVNYLNYLNEYTKWRNDRISKGKLRFKRVAAVKKEMIKVKMVETFGQVMIDQLEVRKEAYDALSTFANLERGAEVLYLQDITNDRFSYDYKGKKYRDRFLKVELPDGRWGWVFNGGINLKKKIVYVKKWIEIPDTRPEVMRNFKYANFKGKVLHYILVKDLYSDLQENGLQNQHLVKDYLQKVSDNPYGEILNQYYEETKKKNKTSRNKTNKDKLNQRRSIATIAEILKDSTSAISNLLKKITVTTAQNLKLKKRLSNKVLAKTKPTNTLIISPPDFTKFTQITSISGDIGRSTFDRPEIVVNTNPLIREETNFPFPIRTSTDFHFDVHLKSSTTATVKLGDQRINLYLQRGDNLYMSFNGNDLHKDLIFTGKGSSINNYFVALSKYFKSKEVELASKIHYATANKFKDFVTKLKIEKLDFLRTYLESHNLTSDAIKYAEADINYWYAYHLMNYPYEHPIFHSQPAPMPLPTDYYDFMEEIIINNTSALPNKYYIYYLQDYLSFQSQKPSNKGFNRYKLADKYLKGKPLYFYKALQYSNEIKRGNDPDIFKQVFDFIENCPYKLYGEFVKLAYHESRGIVEGMDAPNFEVVDKDGNIISLADFKGKVIFLDFWATWCQPCKRMEPAHKKLQTQFKNDNVAFLYVSLDKNANNWRTYLQRGTFPGRHLFANKEMVKKYKVDSLPYSLLIDADGKIVWQHTGGFSVERTAQRILELLQ